MEMVKAALKAIGFALLLVAAGVLVGVAVVHAAEFVPPTPKLGDPAVVDRTGEKADPELAINAVSGVLITQCNQLVAAYVTLSDGRLVRFDVRDQEAISATALEALVFSARVSERVEFSCDGSTIEGFERHEQTI